MRFTIASFELDIAPRLGYFFLRVGSTEIFWGSGGEGWKVCRTR